MATSAILFDILSTIRALATLLLDDSEALVFLLDTIFDTRLVLFASLALVPRPIACDAGFGAARFAYANVWLGSRQGGRAGW